MKFEILFILIYLFWVFFNKRKRDVYLFRADILDKCIDHDNRNYSDFLCNTESSFFWFYGSMPGRNKMIYSFKPLELKYWFKEDLINKLLS